MADLLFKGSPIQTEGDLPQVGSLMADAILVKNDLSRTKLSDYRGQKLILSIFPSIDTGVCATSVRVFNEKMAQLNNTKVVCISKDLPFAQTRFCGAEGIKNVETLSAFDGVSFDQASGLLMSSGPLKGLLSRAIIVLDEEGKVLYTELVDDIVHEPNYDLAIGVL